MDRLAAERWWGDSKVRARNYASACARDFEVAERCAGLLFGAAGRTGYTDWSRNRQNAGHAFRIISRDED